MLPDVQVEPLNPSIGEVVSADETESGPLLGDRPPSPDKYYNAFESDMNILTKITYTVRKLVRLVLGRRNFQILLISFFLTALASSDTKLLVQYISKRYEWTFADVSTLYLKAL